MKFVIYTASCLFRSSAQLAAFLVQRSKDELIQTPLCNAVVHLGIGRLERVAKSENSTKVGTTKTFMLLKGLISPKPPHLLHSILLLSNISSFHLDSSHQHLLHPSKHFLRPKLLGLRTSTISSWPMRCTRSSACIICLGSCERLGKLIQTKTM